MINGHSHNNYSLEDIEKYLQGKMSAGEMHLLEKAALQNPFLADAIEGYSENSLPTARLHLEEIQNRLLQKEATEEHKGVPATEKNPEEEIKVLPLLSSKDPENAFSLLTAKGWYRVAAVLVVMITGFVLWKMSLVGNPDNKQQFTYYKQPGNGAENKNDAIAQTDSTIISADNIKKARARITTYSNPDTASQNIRTGKIRLPGDEYTDKYEARTIRNPDEKQDRYAGNRTSGSLVNNGNQLLANNNGQSTTTAASSQDKRDSTIPTLPPSVIKKDAADNTVAVFSQNLLKQPFLNTGVEKGLQGSVAGLALPKSKIKEHQEKINIRSTQTTHTNNKPLYVIDGIVYDSIPAMIKPTMIDRMEVLKDANATALYGARAANGIIMISTKLKNKQIRGSIVDQSGIGIANASIIVNHNKQNILSDTQGNFTVNSFDSSAIVSVNAVGYEAQQSLVSAGQQNQLVLRQNKPSLNDVIVIGYGTKKRATVTGAVSRAQASNNPATKTIVPGLEKKAAGNATGVFNNHSLLPDGLQPEGGWNNFKTYLLRQISSGTEDAIKGDLTFEFILNKIHKPIHVRILQSPDASKNGQVIEAVEQGPEWITLQKRKNKRSKLKVTFTF